MASTLPVATACKSTRVPLDIGVDRRIDVKADFTPFDGIRAFRSRFICRTAAGVQEGFHRSVPRETICAHPPPVPGNTGPRGLARKAPTRRAETRTAAHYTFSCAAIDSSFLLDDTPGQFCVFCQYSWLHTPGKQTLNPPRLAQVRNKLLDNSVTNPLFDMPPFTAIHDRHQAGLPQGHIRF